MTFLNVIEDGDYQVVRIPRQLGRFSSGLVSVERRGESLVLSEKPRTLGEFMDMLPDTAEFDDWIDPVDDSPQPIEFGGE